MMSLIKCKNDDTICNKENHEYLYHYTKIDTLEKIFNDPKGKNVELQFTDYHFLNDKDEGKWFFLFLEDHKERIISSFDDENRLSCKRAINDYIEYDSYNNRREEQCVRHYSFSLSSLRDSMLFWRQDYASENGIALALDRTIFEEKYPQRIKAVRYLSVETIKEILPNFEPAVKHDAEYIKSRDDYYCRNFSDCLIGARTLAETDFWRIKNCSWEPENEWRIIKVKKSEKESPKGWHTDEFGIGKYEIDNRCVPRYRVKIENPFDEIILGPTFSNYYIKSVKEWLEQHNYKGIKVSRSVGHERIKF